MSEREQLVRGGLWCAGGLLVAAAGLYAAFWLPYRTPAEERPYPLPVLPSVPPQSPDGTSPPRGHGWVDREAGVVRIPIEDAMAIAAERLPVREGTGEAPQAPPTDAGSGRGARPGGGR